MSPRALLALLVACGTPPAARHAPVTAPPPPDAAVPVVRGRLVPMIAHRRPIAAPHAGEIHVLALTTDGKSALTSDELGGVRLWAALDGSSEPQVVDLAEPKQLAIAAHDSGFLVAALDAVGNLTLAQLEADGRTRAKATLSGDAAFTGVAMTASGVLAWRSDETLELYDADGVLTARLGTEPGQRLVGVATNGRDAAAIVEAVSEDKRVRFVRMIAIAPKLAWGAKVDITGDTTGQLALSPSSTRVAVATAAPPDKPGLSFVQIVDVATSKAITTEPLTELTGFGFGDDTHVALGEPNGGVFWLAIGDAHAPPVRLVRQNAPRMLAAGGGRAIATVSGQLGVSTPDDTWYLGYDLESPGVAAAGPDGKLLVGMQQTLALLDASLAVDPSVVPALPVAANVADLVWLGGADWLIESSQLDGSTEVAMVSTDRHAPQTVRANMRVIQPLKYDAASRIATLSLAAQPEIDRYDPVARRIDHVMTSPHTTGFPDTELVPVTPALAAGVQLIKVELRDQAIVEWRRELKSGTPSAHVVVDSFIAADPAGHVYAWNNQPSGPLQLDVYAANGTHLGTLPHDGPVALWPDAKGTRVVEVGQQSVALYTVDGKPVWSQNIGGGSQALWLTDGAIAIITAVGIARLDPATGSVQSARCGWRFGATPKPHPPAPRIEPVCVQLDR